MQLGDNFKLKVMDHLDGFHRWRGGGGASVRDDPGEEMATFFGRGLASRPEEPEYGPVRGEDGDDLLELWKVNEPVAAAAAASWEAEAGDLGAGLDSELSQKVISLEALQRIASGGLPWSRGGRAVVWKLLLRYLPADRDSWDGALAEKRAAYAKLRSELILNPVDSEASREEDGAAEESFERREIPGGDHPLCLTKTSIWHRFFQDAEIAAQIDRDLERTHPNVAFFAGDAKASRRNREAMRSILLLFAKLNPAVGYVQGMNEILAPLFCVISLDPDAGQASNAEADSFFCFVALLSGSVDHFCAQLDNGPRGILSTLAELSALLKANDEELWRHLELSNKVRPQFYAFRWITLLLTQEFPLPAVVRIWDSLLGNPAGVQEMLLRVCCAMLLCARGELLGGDFMANLKLLQSYPPLDLEHLLTVAGKVAAADL